MKNMIVLMGGQGVGKGTFSKMLRERHDYNYIETGAMFRSLPADSEIAKLIAAGNLVPDTELFKLVASKITNDKDLLIDGFPRTLPQAEWLVQNYADKYLIHILYLDVPEEIMLKRITKRINEGGGRADDADATAVRRRLDTFWNVTMPAIEWLRTAPGIKFSDVDVTGPVDENFARILAAMKN
ncbi:nucleoside monophosphate kinase [bacterium]|nr:nucleoside monophosphate kinase [bacterium]